MSNKKGDNLLVWCKFVHETRHGTTVIEFPHTGEVQIMNTEISENVTEANRSNFEQNRKYIKDYLQT